MKQFNNTKNIKGQAIIMVVAILATLFVVTLAFFVLSQAERTAAVRNLYSLRAQYIAEAGIVYAQKVLELDKQTNLIDSLQDLSFKVFEGQDADLDQDGKNESRNFNLNNSDGGPFGRFSIRVSDEASRLNLNIADEDVLGRLFSQKLIDSSKLKRILSRRPLNAKEETGSILGPKDFATLKDFVTIYSLDPEVNLDRERRAYLNSSQARVILDAFLASRVRDGYQKAANLKDAADTDLVQTLLDEFSQSFRPFGLLEPGGWRKIDNFYEASGDTTPGKFIWANLPIDDGEYFCFLYGPAATDVVGGNPPLFSGTGLPEMVEVKGGSFTLSLEPAEGPTSRFSHVELTSPNSKSGLARKIITGTEAVVINELMVKPSKEILTDAVVRLEPGQTSEITFSQIKSGDYYVIVQAASPGGLVGDVSISNREGNNLRDQDYFPQTVSVGGSGNIVLKIKNNSLQEASFKGIKILQEPDIEFIEILNVAPYKIDLDGFSVEVYNSQAEAVSGWPARIPGNTKIQPYQHLILAVDRNDASGSPRNLKNNKISFQSAYKVNAVGLVFDEVSQIINSDSDLLPNSGGKVILKDASGERIDGVEYVSSQIKDFTSLERADPTVHTDADNNGLFDGWYLSESEDSATAASANENPGMYTVDTETGELIKGNISSINVFNRHLTDLSEVQQLSSGTANWTKFSVEDIARMADHFAYQVLTFDLAGHEKAAGADNIGTWEFPGVTPGSYLLSILTDAEGLEGEEIQVGVNTDTLEGISDLRRLLIIQGAAFYGTAEIPKSVKALQINIISDSAEVKSSLQQIQLEPVFSTPGRVNINTASPEILRSVLNSEGLAQTILNNRPIGAKDSYKLGVGELFLKDAGFIPFNNYFTVKSDVYEILCRGDFFPQDKSMAYQTIRTVLERQDQSP